MGACVKQILPKEGKMFLTPVEIRYYLCNSPHAMQLDGGKHFTKLQGTDPAATFLSRSRIADDAYEQLSDISDRCRFSK